MALFQDNPCEPVPEENFWTLWCKSRFTEADTPTIWLGATPSAIFYRLDALPAAQPTVTLRYLCLGADTEGLY